MNKLDRMKNETATIETKVNVHVKITPNVIQ